MTLRCQEKLFQHDCTDCIPLGQHEGLDLYFCTQGGRIPTVLARYGDGGHQYTSGLDGAHVDSALAEAKRRAEERHLIWRRK